MAATADLLIVTLLAAMAPIVVFVLLQKRGAEKGFALLAVLRERRWLSRRRSATSSTLSQTMTPHSMLSKVAPSPHGFLPARVPDFSFNNAVLDGLVQVEDTLKSSSAVFELCPRRRHRRFHALLLFFLNPDLKMPGKKEKKKDRGRRPGAVRQGRHPGLPR